MSDRKNYQWHPSGRRMARGFTLIEMAVVMVVIAFILGGLLVPLATQVEITKIREAREQLAVIKEALLGFAVANERLPCPAIATSNGTESFSVPAIGCNSPHGFVPGRSLGLPGEYNLDQLLVDPWGNPYRYSVSHTDSDPVSTGGPDNFRDFVIQGEMRDVGMANLVPELKVCSRANLAGNDCGPPASTLADGAAAVFYSLGVNGNEYTLDPAQGLGTLARDEMENAGELAGAFSSALSGGPSGKKYMTAGDLIFVSDVAREGAVAADHFDDQVDWISPSLLYYNLVRAGVLP